MAEKLPEFFWKIHSGIPREGPGDNESTKKAYMMLKDLPENPRILDIGCGPGMQTIELAKLSGGQIVALDFYPPFLEQLKETVKQESRSYVFEEDVYSGGLEVSAQQFKSKPGGRAHNSEVIRATE